MTNTASGSFEVTITPRESDDDIAHLAIAKVWTGGLAGTSHGLMLSAGDATRGSAGYVALEIVEGTLDGRAGTLALQQLGVMHDGDQQLHYLVVPGSGTRELTGITGSLELTVDDRGHTYEITYSLA